VNELLRKVRDGELTLSATEISKIAGVSVSFVTTEARDFGLRFQMTGRPRAIDPDEVFSLLDQGIKQADIARKLQASRQAIRNIILRRSKLFVNKS
jgi:hypothetical protein